MRTAVHRVPLVTVASWFACGISLSYAQTTPLTDVNTFDNFYTSDYGALLAGALSAMENGRLTEARQGISDALQVIKVNHGLLSPEQFPALQLLAAASLEQLDLETFDQHLAYFEWLLRKLSVSDFDAYLAGTEILTSLYLDAAAIADNPNNAHYLVAAKQLNWRAVSAIEIRYGKENLDLAPWLYNIVLTHYYQSELTRRKGITSYDYKSTTPEVVSGWSLTKNESLEQSYSIGFELLLRIRTLYANSTKASPLTDALMLTYLADWELIFNRTDAALDLYNTAYEMVRAADTDIATLESWFARPVIIPPTSFSDSWPQTRSSADTTINFVAWSSVFPGVHRPELLVALTRRTISKYSATANFDLSFNNSGSAAEPTDDFEHISCSVSKLRIDEFSPHNDLVASLAQHQISALHFRPFLLDGKPVSGSNFRLNYVFPTETDFSMISDAK